MPVLRHKTPCAECPWRRVHPAGWLGGYEPEAFVQQIQFDGPPLPCHRTIPPGLNMDTDDSKVSMCAGALIFMKNSCKAAYNPGYGDALSQVERDPVNVFQWPQEFLDYHRDREGWLKAAAAKLQPADPLDDDPLDDDDEELAEHRARADAFYARRRPE
jgi:hypothetical protein